MILRVMNFYVNIYYKYKVDNRLPLFLDFFDLLLHLDPESFEE